MPNDPVENTSAGSAHGNLKRVLRHSLQLMAETRLRSASACWFRRGGLIELEARAADPHILGSYADWDEAE